MREREREREGFVLLLVHILTTLLPPIQDLQLLPIPLNMSTHSNCHGPFHLLPEFLKKLRGKVNNTSESYFFYVTLRVLVVIVTDGTLLGMALR
jgi:hypothetical protein